MSKIRKATLKSLDRKANKIRKQLKNYSWLDYIEEREKKSFNSSEEELSDFIKSMQQRVDAIGFNY